MNYKELFTNLYNLKGISAVWGNVLELLESMEPKPTQEELCVYCVYFLFLNDGNICIPLDEKYLSEEFAAKIKTLLVAAENKVTLTVSLEDCIKDIKTGIKQLRENGTGILPFKVIDFENRKWLIADKYLAAKESIQNRFAAIFKVNPAPQLDADNLNREFGKMAGSESFRLKEKQMEALIKGQTSNLIITGGPGTGKTTVVFYLLWELLKNHKYDNYEIKLAAPSGKAADRMKESIRETMETIDRNLNPEIFDRLNNLESYTIHRLLSFNPGKNSFSYNKDNQFSSKTIFVIDEASMIDICLFQSLLEAIPDGARVFILGDKDQLPSVNAGAVLGNLLEKKEESVVKLNESNRFNDNSSVGRLAKAFQKEEELNLNPSLFKKWPEISRDFSFEGITASDTADKNPVFYFSLEDKNKSRQVQEMAEKWSQDFCDILADRKEALCCNLDKTLQDSELEPKLDKIWALSNQAKILCAERKGVYSVETINKVICNRITKNNKILTDDDNRFFAGELLMLTQNQNMFQLYNGDSGVVIQFKDDENQYLMIKKSVEGDFEPETERKGIFKIKSYIFYPLQLLPKNSVEVAYAITIHKSQGSGYKNILIFVPEQSGHPLLNRQILYTAVTRTKGKTFIVGTPEILKEGQKNLITRWTNITFS